MNEAMDESTVWDEEVPELLPRDEAPFRAAESSAIRRLLPVGLGACLMIVSGIVGWGIRGVQTASNGAVQTASSSGALTTRTVPSQMQMPAAQSGGLGAAIGASGVYEMEVDIQGDVVRPGLVTVSDTARVEDVVRAAGGFRHKADASLVNIAAMVTDGEEIVVPGPAETGPAATKGALTQTQSSSHTLDSGPQLSGSIQAETGMNLNTATEAALETLPEIGPGRASAIVAYRASHGPFSSITQLRNVHGIGPTIYGRISPFLFVGVSSR